MKLLMNKTTRNKQKDTVSEAWVWVGAKQPPLRACIPNNNKSPIVVPVRVSLVSVRGLEPTVSVGDWGGVPKEWRFYHC